MLDVIKEFKSIIDKESFIAWADCGGLIHLYRDGYIENDDFDFGIFMCDYPKVLSFLERNKDKWEYFNVRSKELSVKYNGVKFDFLVYEQKDDDIYLYSYKQNPYCGNKWNWEWRCKFPVDTILPIKRMTLCDIEFFVPNNIEERIRLQYGDNWRTPVNVPCWTAEMNLARDNSYLPIAVLMTTIARDEIMMHCVKSYLQFPIKLYLLDQGEHTTIKDEFYNELKSKGHYIVYSEHDIGLSAARNRLMKEINEEYVLITEDDIELVTNPYMLLQRFWNKNNENNLGILGGLLIRQPSGKEQHYEYELSLKDGVLEYTKSANIDLVLNFALAKRALFNDILWDEQLKLSEHTSFYLCLKQLNKWKVDYTKYFVGYHHSAKTKEYIEQYRGRASREYGEMFRNKHGITKIIKDGKVEWTI